MAIDRSNKCFCLKNRNRSGLESAGNSPEAFFLHDCEFVLRNFESFFISLVFSSLCSSSSGEVGMNKVNDDL